MGLAIENYILDLQEAEQDMEYWRRVKLGIIKREDGRTEPTKEEFEVMHSILKHKYKDKNERSTLE